MMTSFCVVLWISDNEDTAEELSVAVRLKESSNGIYADD